MEYFYMRPDIECKDDYIRIQMGKEQYFETEAQVVFSDLSSEREIPDFMEIQFQMQNMYIVSTRMKELLMIYADDIIATPFILVDSKEKKQENFWKIKLKEIEELSCENINLTEKVEDLQIQNKFLKNQYIVAFRRGRKTYWIASLHFAENFMRKNMFGVNWVKVKMEEMDYE